MSDDTNVPDLEVKAATVSDGAYTLLVADFSDTKTAWEAHEALKSVEDGRNVEIEGVIVVSRSDEGKLEVLKATDHSTKSGLKWGLVGGIALGVIFPPSILGAPPLSDPRALSPASCGNAITMESWSSSWRMPLRPVIPA